MPTSSVENSSHKMLYNTGINNTLAWKVTQNWQVTAQYSLINAVANTKLSATLIYDSLYPDLLYPVVLWRTIHMPSFCFSLSFACKGPLFFFFFFERTKIIPATGGSWTLPLNKATEFKQQQGNKSDSFFRGNTKWGCPRWKERKQGSRKWLLQRCILFNLAIRKLNSINKRRVFLTYIDVPEFLL